MFSYLILRLNFNLITQNEQIMATTEKKQGEGQQPTQSAKERYRGRYAEAHPDMNLDDEEAFYGQANANLDELENYRESNRQLGEAFDKTPLLAGLVYAAKEGKNPFAFLVENIGPDMDIRELANNPEFAETMGKALTTFQENQQKAKDKEKKIGENCVKSLQVLKELQQERGLSDEECVKMCNDFFGEFDENGNPIGKDSFMANASMGIVTKGMWESLVNGRHYDADIADAKEKASASALNGRIQNGLRNFGEEPGVPSLSGASHGTVNKPKEKKGGFRDWGTEEG